MIIRNANIACGPFSGLCADIVCDNGKILRISPAGSALPEGAETLDASGLTAFPGLIDAHCHLRDPGFEYKEDIESGTLAAAAGGFTRVACMPNTKPVADNAAVITYIKERAAAVGHIKVLPIGAISKGEEGRELAEMGDMRDAGAVAVSDDGKPVMSSSLMRKALLYASHFSLPVISHCEDTDLCEGGSMNEGTVSTKLGLRGIPSAAEEIMVSRELILSEYLGLPVHIAHVSSRRAVSLIRDAKARGARVTAETCPHYFSLTDGALMSYDTNAKVNPPLRTGADVSAVIAGLADGTLDMISTDHAPHHADEKNVEFEMAANGISGFETAFSLAYTKLVLPGHLDLRTLCERMIFAPARLLSQKDVGLEEGRCADIMLADLSRRRTVRAADFYSKGKNTPFDGMMLTGCVMYTFVDGKKVFPVG